jgi:hypothetical protein
VGRERESWTRSVVVREGWSVMVGATEVEGRLWAKMEANPSRFADPDGCSLVAVEDLAPAVEAMWSVAERYVTPGGPKRAARVKRLDLARDFSGVTEPGYYVRGLAGVHRPYAKRVGLWTDPQKGSAQTLHAGSGAGMVRLYDQHEAYAERGAVRGAVRWEVEARADWLGRIAAIRVLSDITPAAVMRLAGDRWGWSGMGVEVAATDMVVERVLRAEHEGLMTEREGEAFLGWLLTSSRGVARPLSTRTAGKYRKWVRLLGITMGPLGESTADAFMGRLDWDSGEEILRVA